jgi:predicted metal-dependent peptidase
MKKDIDLDVALQQAKLLGVVPHQYGDNINNELVYKYLLLHIPVIETDEVDVAALEFRNSKFRILVNIQNIAKLFEPYYADQNEFIAVVRGIIKHELLHFLYKHYVPKSGNINFRLLNIAEDALINRMIPEFKNLNLPFIKAEDIFDPEVKDYIGISGTDLIKEPNSEALYTKLEEMIPDEEEELDMLIDLLSSLLGSDDSSGNNGGGNNNNNGKTSEQSDNDSSNGEGENDSDSGDKSNSKEAKKKKLAELIDKLIEKAILKPGENKTITEDALEEAEIFSGNIAKSAEADKLKRTGLGMQLLKLMYKPIKPVMNWKNVVTGTLGEFYKDISFRRFSKRYDIPPGPKTKYTGKVLAMIDVSGSIAYYVEKFISEILNIVRDFDLEAVFYDYGVQKTYNKNQLIKKEFEITGGGGTSLKNALSQVRVQKYDVIVVFTDGYDDIPDRKDFKGKKVVFVFPEDEDSRNEHYIDEVKKIGKVGIFKPE